MENKIQLPEFLIKDMIDTFNQSIAEKRKVSAIIFDNNYNRLSYGYNQNIVNNGICENSNNETFDTVIHAEQACIFNYFTNHNPLLGKELNMLVSYSPCIECSKQIVISNIIKNLYIYEEHEINFRQPQYISGSMSPLEFLLENNINVYIYNKESKLFEQVIKKTKNICIYHSKDLDGFMSRYLVENFHPEKDTFKFVGYNYESNTDWMHDNYDNYLFIDITPTNEWLKQNLHKNITIFDHHENTIRKFIDNFDIMQTNKTNFAFVFRKNNIEIYLASEKNISACKLFYCWLNYKCFNTKKLNLIDNLVSYISEYDTWSFINYPVQEKDYLLNIIESLKVLNYTEFESILNSINENSINSILSKLNFSGNFIRISKENDIQKALEKSLVHYKFDDKKSINLVIASIYPSYDLECYLREKYENKIPTIYVGYTIDLQNNKVNFSVRYYPIENINLSVNALTIAENYAGGGHPNAAGFTITLNMFTELLKTKFSQFKYLINNK